ATCQRVLPEDLEMGVERKPEFFAGKGLKIGIIGCGYVGLPLGLRFADEGQFVTGFDLEAFKVKNLYPAVSSTQHSPAAKIKEHVQGNLGSATTDATKLKE